MLPVSGMKNVKADVVAIRATDKVEARLMVTVVDIEMMAVATSAFTLFMSMLIYGVINYRLQASLFNSGENVVVVTTDKSETRITVAVVAIVKTGKAEE